MELSNKQFLTVYETAKILQVHYNTIYELIKTKKLKAVKIGKTFRITQDFINEFVNTSCSN